MSARQDYDVIIAGGGPAGASVATHLALKGARVLLLEQKKFPRPKLCGEFISPECAVHFERLGVKDQMFAARPAALTETVFYSRTGRHVSVPSSWFSASAAALGLSRAEMDERLLRRATAAGADVLEQASVANLIIEDQQVRGVKVKQADDEKTYRAAVTVDATGRARGLTRHLASGKITHRQRQMIAFKAHLEQTQVAAGACEIYFYRGGYGGLSSIEDGLSNLCFIAAARDVRACGSDPDRVMREIVCENRRARITLENSSRHSEWLAVSLEGFGYHDVAPAPGLLAVGDAASFIDPFTGSGMLMALQSGELAAHTIDAHLNGKAQSASLEHLRQNYSAAYRLAFASRLTVCSFLRRAAFVPGLAETAIRFFAASAGLRRRLARATRGSEVGAGSGSDRVM
jgi:flavin-dependent dehydrogenase